MLTKVHIVKSIVFPVVMYKCENWTIRRLSANELIPSDCVAGGLLTLPWTLRRSRQSMLKEINPEYSLGGLMLKLQYFSPLMQITDSLEKTLMLGIIEDQKRRWQRMRWLDSTANSKDT